MAKLDDISTVTIKLEYDGETIDLAPFVEPISPRSFKVGDVVTHERQGRGVIKTMIEQGVYEESADVYFHGRELGSLYRVYTRTLDHAIPPRPNLGVDVVEIAKEARRQNQVAMSDAVEAAVGLIGCELGDLEIISEPHRGPGAWIVRKRVAPVTFAHVDVNEEQARDLVKQWTKRWPALAAHFGRTFMGGPPIIPPHPEAPDLPDPSKPRTPKGKQKCPCCETVYPQSEPFSLCSGCDSWVCTDRCRRAAGLDSVGRSVYKCKRCVALGATMSSF